MGCNNIKKSIGGFAKNNRRRGIVSKEELQWCGLVGMIKTMVAN